MQFGVSAVLAVGVLGVQSCQWSRSLDVATQQWNESLATSTEQWDESLRTSTDQWNESLRSSGEQWRLEGPVIQAVGGVAQISGHTNLELDFDTGTYTEQRDPYTYAYVLSNTGRTDATILSASLLDSAGETIVLPTLCGDGPFPITLAAGSSMVVAGRSEGPIFYSGGVVRVLLSSGLSQQAQVLELDDPTSDAEIFRSYYAELFASIPATCEPMDFTASAP